MTGPLSADGVEWTESLTRPAVSARSGGVCEACSMQRATDKHHRINASQGGQWNPANILDLCRLCHHRVTVNPAWAKSVGLSVEPSTDGRPTDPAMVPVQTALGEVWLTDALIAKAGAHA